MCKLDGVSAANPASGHVAVTVDSVPLLRADWVDARLDSPR